VECDLWWAMPEGADDRQPVELMTIL
jgi:hypothetical protein